MSAEPGPAADHADPAADHAAAPKAAPPRRLTVTDIARMYWDGERIPMVTAYDFPTARILDDAGIPLLLVGDSVGQVMLGYDTTVSVTMDDMLHHTRAVSRAARRALVIGDMPFLSYATPKDALANAGRFLRDGGAHAVKIEGGRRSARIVEALVSAGIAVQGHIGLSRLVKESCTSLFEVGAQGLSVGVRRPAFLTRSSVGSRPPFYFVEYEPDALVARDLQQMREE